jgi:hypothetical protein
MLNTLVDWLLYEHGPMGFKTGHDWITIGTLVMLGLQIVLLGICIKRRGHVSEALSLCIVWLMALVFAIAAKLILQSRWFQSFWFLKWLS